MRAIFLIMIGLGTLVFADFTKNGDIVTDTITNLQWQDDTDARSVKKIWESAIDYCETLTLGGYSDWRLPNINELKSIVDRNEMNPSIVYGFTNVSMWYYWSSTTNIRDSYRAWSVMFEDGGYVDFRDKSLNYYVRCVRDRQ